MSLKATINNPDPIPIYIKLESVSDDENLDNEKSDSFSLRLPIKLPVSYCCEYEKKLEEFKLESSRALHIALKSKSDEIRLIRMENKRLLNNEKLLLHKINLLKRQLRNYMYIHDVQKRSDSQQENYNNNNKNTHKRHRRDTNEKFKQKKVFIFKISNYII